MPVLETSLGQLIYESAITCEYLDEAYPEKKLLPGDPYEKACQKMVFESFSKVPPLISRILRTQNKEDCSGLKEELRKEITKLEEVINPFLILIGLSDILYPHSFLLFSSYSHLQNDFKVIRNNIK